MYKQVIIVRTDLKMNKGKIAAQACHACLDSYKKALKQTPSAVTAWELTGAQKTVLKVSSERELIDLFENARKKFPACLIRDAGHTQIPSGSKTCVGIGPALEKDLDKLTGHLKLL